MTTNPPDLVFIIPYRDRIEHKTFFDHYMRVILEDLDEKSYTFMYVHQNDKRKFNRGAMKNIGFLYLKQMYPNDYKNITLIFNDIDTVPYKKGILDYTTESGIIKHFYGYKFALGGIFSIKASDFEKINGFPNYWNWGFEDNIIYRRAKQYGIQVDRTNFYDIFSKTILHFSDDFRKLVSRDIHNKISQKNFIETDGLRTLRDLNFTIENDMLQVYNFSCNYSEQDNDVVSHTLFDGINVKPKQKYESPFSMKIFGRKKLI